MPPCVFACATRALLDKRAAGGQQLEAEHRNAPRRKPHKASANHAKGAGRRDQAHRLV